MTDVANEPNNDKPLDPATEALRKKMIRLMVVSIGIMFVGIFAVLFGIIYKINNLGASGALIDTVIELPTGFVVEQSERDADLLLLRGKAADQENIILLYDFETGEPRGKISLK